MDRLPHDHGLLLLPPLPVAPPLLGRILLLQSLRQFLLVLWCAGCQRVYGTAPSWSDPGSRPHCSGPGLVQPPFQRPFSL